MAFEDMGPSWVPLRDAVETRTLRTTDRTAPDVVLRFEALLRFAGLQLGRRLGTDVTPALLIADPQKDIRGFRVEISVPMGSKRGTGRNSFIDSVLNAVSSFYEEIVQNLKPWSATPPKIRAEAAFVPPEDVPVALVSTAPSSQDGPELHAPVVVPAQESSEVSVDA